MTGKTYWNCIAKRDAYGNWDTEPGAFMKPAEARRQWDAGIIDMAQKRTGEFEFSLYIHIRKERDQKRQPMFSIKTDDEYKSVRPLTRLNRIKRKF